MVYSLRARLIVMFSLLLLIPFTVLIGIVIGVSTDVVGQLIRVSTSQTMNQYAEYVEKLTVQAEETADQVLANETTQEWIEAQLARKSSSVSDFGENLKLRQYLSGISSNTSNIESIGVFLDGSHGIWSYSDAYAGSEWYHEFRSSGMPWTPSHLDPEQPLRSMREVPLNSYLYPLTLLTTLQNVGVIKVNLSTEMLRRPLDQLRLGETGSVYLINQTGKPVLGQDLSPHEGIILSGLERISSEVDWEVGGNVKVSQGGRTYLLFYRSLGNSGWLMAGVVSEEELFSRITSIQNLMILISGILLLLGICAAFWLSSGVARPLTRLAASMKLAQNGDFDNAAAHLPAVKSTRSEVSYVILGFYRMISRLKDYIRMEVELNLRRRDAEYKALLLQINPHFLYNTLETIGSLSAQGRTADVARVTESLGRMLRYSLKLDSDIVFWQEELKYVRDYASILQLVYGDRVRLVLPDDHGHAQERVQILKFILQPLVENAFKYSMDLMPVAEVRVESWVESDKLTVSVSDNGIGMDPSLVDKLMEPSNWNDGGAALRSGGSRIGLRNVLARCSLYYGERFRFRIESAPGCGSTFILELPLGGVQDV